MSVSYSDFDLRQQIAAIDRAQAETRKFVAEREKLIAEAEKFRRDRSLAPWQIVVTLLGGAAMAAAVATVVAPLAVRWLS